MQIMFFSTNAKPLITLSLHSYNGHIEVAALLIYIQVYPEFHLLLFQITMYTSAERLVGSLFLCCIDYTSMQDKDPILWC